jgi:hypothetical protein
VLRPLISVVTKEKKTINLQGKNIESSLEFLKVTLYGKIK